MPLDLADGREGLRVKIDPIPGVTPKRLMGRTGYYFQCPPLDTFQHDHAHSHGDYDTVYKGQFSRKGGRQLRTTSFDTLAVDWGTYTVLRQPIIIEDFTASLIALCEAGDPFVLTIAHEMPPHGFDDWNATFAGPELQMEATLRTLTVSEKHGEGDARYVNVSFTEYRAPFNERALKGKKRRATKQFPKTCLLKKDGRAEDKDTGIPIGDPPLNPLTLSRLAKFYYHDPSLWRAIANQPKNHINQWGANDALVEYFLARNVKHWPAKIQIPSPPQKGRFIPDG